MNKNKKRRLTGIVIFIFIAAVSLIIFKPISISLEKKLTEVKETVISSLEKEYNITIKYGSMSPAFFKRILIRDVSIYNAENNEKIAFFSLIYFDYRFFSLIKKDAAAVISAIRIYDGNINFSTVKNKNILNKFINLNASEEQKYNLENELKTANAKKLQFFETELKKLKDKAKPANIILRNISINYSTENLQFGIYLSRGNFNLNSERTEFKLNSKFSFHNFAQKNFSGFFTQINVSGSFYHSSLTASSIVNFTQIKVGDLSVNKISLFTSYKDKVISVRTLQDIHPIDVKGSWNIAENSGSLSMECKNLYPLTIANFSKINKSFKDLNKLKITGGLKLEFKNKEDYFWNTDFNLELPPLKFNDFKFDTANVKLNMQGDSSVIRVNRIYADGRSVNASLSGVYKIKEIMPDFKLNISKLKLINDKNLFANLKVYSTTKKIYADITELNIGDSHIEKIQTIFEKKENKTDFYISGKDMQGNFNIDGSWLYPTRSKQETDLGYLEMHGSMDSVGIKNIYFAAQSFSAGLSNLPSSIADFLEPVQMTNEFYISTDFKQFSYNIIQAVLASGSENGFYSLFSANGNNNSAQVDDIDIVFGKVNIRGAFNTEFENTGAVFGSTFTVNGIPYKTSGLYSDNELSLYGDYGININVFNDKKKIRGSFQVAELPLPFINAFFSANTSFEYSDIKRWNINCNIAKIEYVRPALRSTDDNVEFSVAGYADPMGVFFHDVKLGKKSSFLSGSASLNLVSESGTDLRTYTANILLSDIAKKENLTFSSSISVSDKMYFNGKWNFENLSLDKFFRNQKQENKINTEIVFLGSNDILSLKLDLKELNANFNGENLTAKSVLTVDDKDVLLSDTNLKWGIHTAEKISAKLDLLKGEGNLLFDYSALSKNLTAKSSFEFDFKSNSESISEKNLLKKLSNLISYYTVNMKIKNWVLEDKKGAEEISAVFVKEPNIIAVYAGEGDKVYGFKTNDGLVSLHIDESLPLHLNLDGTFTKEAVNLNVADIYINLPWIANIIPNNETVKFDTGKITGNLTISGTQSDPLFFGDLIGKDITGTSPYYSPDKYGSVDVPIKFSGTMLNVPYTVLPGKTGSLWAEVSSEFIGWIPYETIIKCGTIKNSMGLIKTKNLAFHADGKAGTEIKIEITPELINLEGYADFDNGFFSIPFSELYKIQEKYSGGSGNTRFTMNLKLNLGKKSEFRYPSTDFPFLRTFAYTEAPIVLIVDSGTGLFEMHGSAKIRTGELFYIKRNFYIKEGELELLNIEGKIEPLVSLRAEIRDKTSSGQPVTIILTAKNQHLDIDRFRPVLSALPAMSDTEIMTLMGQVALGDVNKGNVLKETLINASDIFAQLGFLRKVEDKVRNTLKLDVFSMRTLFVQNLIFGNLFKSSVNTPLTIGNYFDNTSVYIGKYFGSAIYADAMLHLSYYDPLSSKEDIARKPVYGNLLFQPELGLEMNTPFFLLRWHIAPSRPDTAFVSDTGLTISWKFSY